MTINALFVDRDGTINVEKGYVHKITDVEYIPGALAGLKLATERNLKIYIVTNQAGIAKGKYTERDFEHLMQIMIREMGERGIEIADVLYCPHHPEGTVAAYRQVCDCRKPAAGLLTRVIERDGLSAEHLALIGDKNSDIEAGRRLGLRTYLVETGYGLAEKSETRADFVVADLEAAIQHVLRTSDRLRGS
jgi:D-glycero-D-manno-heptose 1,7-bisphosphate phosphatase